MGKYIMDIDGALRKEIADLLCLSFANALFCGEIKFHRTKQKPLMRHRTLVKSQGIHIELEKLHKSLTVRTFIQNAKNKRKRLCKKSNIIAGDFFVELKKFVNLQYLRQKRRVYSLLNDKDSNLDDLNEENIIFGDNDSKNSMESDENSSDSVLSTPSIRCTPNKINK